MTPEDLAARLYWDRATALDVHDGDTFTADVDLGYRAGFKPRVRLARIDAPELREDAGPAAREVLRSLLGGRPFYVRSLHSDRTGHEIETFERVVCEVYLADGTNVSDAMVAAGHATYVTY